MSRHFISYSSADGQEFALRLRDELEAGEPSFPVWLDRRDIQTGQDWDTEIVRALQGCPSLLFVMTLDSVEDASVCKNEWTRALKYKKPIVPIKLRADAEMPFRLDPRQHIDFTRALESEEEFDAALARLRLHLKWLASPAGALQALKDRLADAQRDLRRAEEPAQQARIKDDIEQLKKDVAKQEEVVRDPVRAERRVEESIARGLERERTPERAPAPRSKFINPPPGLAPTYFQNRHVETGMLGGFLKDDALRLVTVVGRGGTGKTALVCRLLKSLEGGQLPDDGGPLEVDGIVYLSATGTRRVNMPNIYSDLSKLLKDEAAATLDALFKNPQASTEAKMGALLSNFAEGRTVVLLDNFEDMIEPETLALRDAELDEALRALLDLPHHTVKVILTTRVAPRSLALFQPSRQRRLDLDEGLASPYAENILREMDADGKVNLKDAPDELLNEARERTRGYPRALEALFAILSADRDTTLRDILDDTTNLLPENVVRDLVGEAFNRLDTAAQHVMQALAVYGHPVTHAAIDYLLQPHLPGVDSAPVLKRLVNMQFARRETGRYYLHPVDRTYALSRIPRGEPSNRYEEDTQPYTQFALLHRAAEYFKQSRLPREDWKTIEDLAPQLAEFDLRCAGEDYETSARVLVEIDSHLYRWGFYLLLVASCERLLGLIEDSKLNLWVMLSIAASHLKLGNYDEAMAYANQELINAREMKSRVGERMWLETLGDCYRVLGYTPRSIECYEQSLVMARETKSLPGEAYVLNSLGICYGSLGQTSLAIECLTRTLTIERELGNHFNEAVALVNLAEVMIDEGRNAEAVQYTLESVRISHELNKPGSYGYCWLALAYLYAGDLTAARKSAEAARQFDEPVNNHNALSLLGLIQLRQAELASAYESFTEALKQADLLLTRSVRNFEALYAKGLALSGMVLCDNDVYVPDAIEAYKAARNVNNEAGMVGRALRLLDALAEGDEAGVLAGVRAAVAGE
jgi:tetratricopeptide (TPR) repeat protein